MEFERAELKWPLCYFALHNSRDHGGKLSNVMLYFLRRKTQSQGFTRPNASDSQSHSFKSIHNMTQ